MNCCPKFQKTVILIISLWDTLSVSKIHTETRLFLRGLFVYVCVFSHVLQLGYHVAFSQSCITRLQFPCILFLFCSQCRGLRWRFSWNCCCWRLWFIVVFVGRDFPSGFSMACHSVVHALIGTAFDLPSRASFLARISCLVYACSVVLFCLWSRKAVMCQLLIVFWLGLSPCLPLRWLLLGLFCIHPLMAPVAIHRLFFLFGMWAC